MLAAHAVVAADDAAVPRARGEQVDLQHAAGVRDLHHAAGLKWLLKEGGLAAIDERNARKADKLYAEIDRTGFYRGHAQKDSRSRMNVTFRLPSEELEKKFAKEATAAGLDGLKGHRRSAACARRSTTRFPRRASTRSSSSCRNSKARTDKFAACRTQRRNLAKLIVTAGGD